MGKICGIQNKMDNHRAKARKCTFVLSIVLPREESFFEFQLACEVGMPIYGALLGSKLTC